MGDEIFGGAGHAGHDAPYAAVPVLDDRLMR